MSGAQFTPGPWAPDVQFNFECVSDAGGLLVADCEILGLGTARTSAINQANARLIAAAPDLLTALQGLLTVCPPASLLAGPEMQAWMNARAAVTKATGQQVRP